jgi:uncharacterized membrane protein YphA (DoxX/SURF4 family)
MPIACNVIATGGMRMRIGVYVFGIASVASGVLNLIWGEFEPDHQPLQAWGDWIASTKVLAWIGAVWLIAGGLAVLWKKTALAGAIALTVLYAIFTMFPLPRFVIAPHYLGYSLKTYLGVTGSVAEQLVLFLAAAILWGICTERGSLSPRLASIARWAFGLCVIFFGLGQIMEPGYQMTVQMVPKWMPFGGPFWAILTGICFVLAGLAIALDVVGSPGARWLGIMLLVFSALVLVELPFADPHDHVAWGANAYNLSVVGAAWIAAEWLKAGNRDKGIGNRIIDKKL